MIINREVISTTWTDGPRDGATYVPEHDFTRLNRQARLVAEYMVQHGYCSLREISLATGQPEASISARLRDLRKERFGGHMVERRRRASARGTWEYRFTAVSK